jgi:anaerobic selenocysteine-containing dehydrogenase
MIVLGGSSMHKGENSWQAGRAIACLPALTGNLGIPGGGFGPRHGSSTHGQALANIAAEDRRPPGTYIPSQMERILEALQAGRIQALLLFGTNMLSSFADANALAAGLERTNLVVSHDLFMNDTARRFADVVLPSTSWLEEVGCKMTNTHLYLMEKALAPPGEARSLQWVLRALATRLGLTDFYPWATEEGVIDALLDHPSTGHATVAALRAEGGMRALQISHVAHPDYHFATPSGKIEFYSARAAALGLSPLPVCTAPAAPQPQLVLAQGRTLTHFHSFYDHGRALPTLARLDAEPAVWIAPDDAAVRGIVDGKWVRLHNARGALQARAYVTNRVPPGTVWMRDGWEGLNCVTSARACIPDTAVDLFPFAAGQAAFDALVDVAPV